MLNSNAFSLPAFILAASITLSIPTSVEMPSLTPASRIEAADKTLSYNPMTIEYGKMKASSISKRNAFELFNKQTSYSADERKTYNDMLASHSTPVGINIFDFL